jgi:small subunit ribosomal protein S16
MSIKIRLARHGRRNAPYYRMVVADTRYPRDGRFVEILGFYHPLNKTEAEQVKVDEAKVLDWLGKGAIPSDTCRSLLRKQGIMKKFHEAKVAAKAAVKAAKA